MVTQGEGQRFASKAPSQTGDGWVRSSPTPEEDSKEAEGVISGPSGVFCSGDPDTKRVRPCRSGTADSTFWNTVSHGEPLSETLTPGSPMRKCVPGERDLVPPLHFWGPQPCHSSLGPFRPNEGEVASPKLFSFQGDACRLSFPCSFLGTVEAFLPGTWRMPTTGSLL